MCGSFCGKSSGWIGGILGEGHEPAMQWFAAVGLARVGPPGIVAGPAFPGGLMPVSRSDRFILTAAILWLAVQVSPLWYPAPDSGAYLSIARGLARDGALQN